jgi:hypothetical protein
MSAKVGDVSDIDVITKLLIVYMNAAKSCTGEQMSAAKKIY